jgi:hypothetical protein
LVQWRDMNIELCPERGARSKFRLTDIMQNDVKIVLDKSGLASWNTNGTERHQSNKQKARQITEQEALNRNGR